MLTQLTLAIGMPESENKSQRLYDVILTGSYFEDEVVAGGVFDTALALQRLDERCSWTPDGVGKLCIATLLSARVSFGLPQAGGIQETSWRSKR